jgi:hypothetical protein
MIITLTQKHKDAIRGIIGRAEFPTFIDFIRSQKNNIAVLEWQRTSSEDPKLNLKKAKFEGMVEIIDMFIRTFEKVQKETKDDGESA